MKRELYKMFDQDSSYGKGFPVLSKVSDNDLSSASNRVVTIPKLIKHLAILQSDTRLSDSNPSALSDEKLSSKIVAVKELWESEYKDTKRGIMFVPTVSDVKQIVGMMKFWGMNEVKNFQETLGFTMDSPDKISSKPRRFGKSKKIHVNKNNLSFNAIVSLASESRIGHGKSKDDSISEDNRELFVVSITSARGLHIQDIETVFILTLPSTMDEYLHMAGRTGRVGNKKSGGTVITIIDLIELKRIQSWQNPLGIDVELVYK